MPLALAVYGTGEASPEVEKIFFAKLRLPNGTWKTTYPHRLDDLNDLLLPHLPRDRALAVMDVAVSSGVSTLEWAEQLSANGIEHRLVAADLITDGWLKSWGECVAVLFDDSGRDPLLLEVGQAMLPIRSERRFAKLLRPLLSPLLRGAPGGRRRPVSLINAELRGRAGSRSCRTTSRSRATSGRSST